MITNFEGKVPLRLILIIPFVLIIIGTVGLVGYLSLKNGEDAVKDVAIQFLDDVTAKVEKTLPSYLYVPVKINQANAIHIELEHIDLNNIPALEHYFWRLVNVYDKVAQIGVGLENKDIIVAERFSRDLIAIRTSSKASRYIFGTFQTNEKGEKIKLLSSIPFEPRKRPWYLAAVKAGKPVWGEIYPNTAGITSYLGTSMPFYNKDKKLQGVLLTTINLGQIGDYLKSLTIGKTGQAFIIERNGWIVATSTGEQPFTKVNKSYGAVRMHATHTNNAVTSTTAKFLAEYLKKVKAVDSIHQELFINGDKQYVVVRPFRDPLGLDWLIVVVVPEQDFMDKINTNTRYTVLLCLAALGLAVLIGSLLTLRITNPLQRLTKYIRDLISQDFKADGAVRTGMEEIAQSRLEEVGYLASSFINMEQELQNYVVKVRDTAAAKERIESDLRVGRKIQMSVLPRKFPPFPKRKEIDVYAHIEPAKEMSGDFFDFYLINQNLLYFTIGDVSGKGVPASLLMVTARVLLEVMANEGVSDPEVILSKVNTEIVRKNDAMLFVTVFYAILDLTTGALRYSNAGHNPPYVLRRDGRIEMLSPQGKPEGAIGIDEDKHYRGGRLQLEPGDAFFLYTDGVTEAMNTMRDQFTEARLEAILQQANAAPVTDLIKQVVAEVKSFAGEEPQSDDITVLAIRYHGMADAEQALGKQQTITPAEVG